MFGETGMENGFFTLNTPPTGSDTIVGIPVADGRLSM